jgi:peptidoglycan-associated lipoprotein
MSIRHLPTVVVVALLAIAGSASAAPVRPFNSPVLLFDAPTADVLPAGSVAIAADVTYPLTKTSMNVDYPEVDASVRFSPMKHLDLAVTAYTFQDYVLDVKYQILGGAPGKFGLAVGVCDVGLQSYVSPIGRDTADAWPDWKYRHEGVSTRTWENLSGFAVTSIPLLKIARLHLGLGRGRFVGYDGINDYLNTDVFFDSYHQWAVSLFGGLELYVLPNVALVAEASSRDMNSGIRAHFGPITATVAWEKMEGFIIAKGEPDGTPHFGRIAAGVSCRFDRIDLSGLGRLIPRREPYVPVEPVPPPPEPVEIPTAPSAEVKHELLPIHFDLDKSDIRPGDAKVLRQNAATILARQKAGLKAEVVIEGHCCPYASEAYNVGLGARRAESARLYLVKLGVDAALLATESRGEAHPVAHAEAEYYLDRRCEFRWKE